MSKTLIMNLLKISDKIKVKVISGNLDNPVPGKKWKYEAEGVFIDNMSDKGFNQKQLEQLQGLLQPIVQRLDNLEKDVKDLKQDVKDFKSCPTIAKELKETKK